MLTARGGDGDPPQPGGITSSPVRFHGDVPLTKAGCSSQEISSRLVFAIARVKMPTPFFTSPDHFILYRTANRTLFLISFLVDQPISETTSQISTRSWQVCCVLAIAPNQPRMMLINKSALRAGDTQEPDKAVEILRFIIANQVHTSNL